MARRSKELMKFTIEECNLATTDNVDYSIYYTVNVAQHKGRKNKSDAFISWTKIEFDAMNIYITTLRPLLTTDGDESIYVFTVKNRGKPNQNSKSMAFSTVHNILKQFKITSGETFSSRIIRKSTVHLAKSMSHTTSTAIAHYDELNAKNSVLSCIAKYNRERSGRCKINSEAPSTSKIMVPSTNASMAQSLSASWSIAESMSLLRTQSISR